MLRRTRIAKIIGIVLILAGGTAFASPHSAKEFGAKGNGVADDTAALQAAIDASTRGADPGELLIPAGIYRVSKTLVVNKVSGVTIRGEGSMGIGVPKEPSDFKQNGTLLIWVGPDGGTLLKVIGTGAMTYRDLALCGRDRRDAKQKGRAGILFHAVAPPGLGNMINRISGLSFTDAGVGLQMGGGTEDMANTDSDILMEFLTFRELTTGMKVKHMQGVNYRITFLFGLACDTVLHFEEGGNVMADNMQMTGCKLVVRIDRGCRNSGTYLFNNLRVEGFGAGNVMRSQILKCNPKEQATVRFINYDDVQWWWSTVKDPVQRYVPLCEIGPGSTVVFETSIFNSPLARLTGDKGHPARLIVRESHFNYVKPQDSLVADEFGYFKTLDCSDHDGGNILPDLIKWPRLETINLPPEAKHYGKDLVPPAQP